MLKLRCAEVSTSGMINRGLCEAVPAVVFLLRAPELPGRLGYLEVKSAQSLPFFDAAFGYLGVNPAKSRGYAYGPAGSQGRAQHRRAV